MEGKSLLQEMLEPEPRLEFDSDVLEIPTPPANSLDAQVQIDKLLYRRRKQLNERALHDALYETRRLELEGWYQGEGAKLTANLEHLDASLRILAEGFREELFATKKSRSFPGGKLGFRATQPKVLIDSDARAREWARVHAPDALTEKTTHTLSKTILRELLEIDEELRESGFDEGVELQPAGETFYVEVK